MKDFSINGDYPVGLTKDLEKISQANSKSTRQQVTSKYEIGKRYVPQSMIASVKGAVILSYRHKGSIDPGNTHIVSLQRADIPA